METEKRNTILFKIGYFFPLTLFGMMHFLNPNYFEFLVPEFVPGGIFWVYFSGFALSTSSLAIIFNFVPKLTAICLLLFVLTFIISVDIPGVIFGDQNRFLISLLKDSSLFTGTSLFLYNMYN